ncbi:ABC transporter permease [Fusobacterium varium]|uniref:ABC transporter permease n=1 Tax=Fusobacterium varium TaxID=856 RepID=UPI001F45ED7D|nr:FtsX-like permease family protein [Fusobacterium varium]MCF2673609.1 ABC transporter permease [Fusobacterium varium]
MLEFFIAKKYILERKKQSLSVILGIAIGVIVLIVSIGIDNGLKKERIKTILSTTSHILVSNGQKLLKYNDLKKQIEAIKGVKVVLPSIEEKGILKYFKDEKKYIYGVKIEGLELENAKKGMELDKKIIKGNIPLNKIKGVLIGKELTEKLGTSLEDKISIISSQNQEMELEIEGVFQTGFYDYDSNVIIVPLKVVQKLSQQENTVDKIKVMLNNPYEASEIANKIMSETKIFSRTWGELNKNLLSALMLEKTVMIIILSLISIIAEFTIYITLNMLVKEKIKDIGIMRAMGFTKKNIMKIFLIQGIILGIIGIILGIIIALFFLWYIKNFTLTFITSIYHISKIPVEISIKEIGGIIGANIGIIFIVSIFPAYRVAKMETVEALKYD